MINRLVPGSPQSVDPLVPKPKEDPEKIKNAARQFESLLIAQMLKSMKSTDGGWLGTGEDQSASSAMDYAEEIFAQSLSAKGGLGLANLVVQGLKS